MIYFSSQPGRRYVEGYKEELNKRKMKISSWRLLEPSKRKLEVQFRKGKLQFKEKGEIHVGRLADKEFLSLDGMRSNLS